MQTKKKRKWKQIYVKQHDLRKSFQRLAAIGGGVGNCYNLLFIYQVL